MTLREKQRECFLLFLCFRKLPKVQLTVMTNTGKEHLTLTQLPYNTVSCLTALPCQRNGHDVGKLDIPGYGRTHHLSSAPYGGPPGWTWSVYTSDLYGLCSCLRTSGRLMSS